MDYLVAKQEEKVEELAFSGSCSHCHIESLTILLYFKEEILVSQWLNRQRILRWSIVDTKDAKVTASDKVLNTRTAHGRRETGSKEGHMLARSPRKRHAGSLLPLEHAIWGHMMLSCTFVYIPETRTMLWNFFRPTTRCNEFLQFSWRSFCSFLFLLIYIVE